MLYLGAVVGGIGAGVACGMCVGNALNGPIAADCGRHTAWTARIGADGVPDRQHDQGAGHETMLLLESQAQWCSS
jgi:hypothetical protein